MKPLFEIKPIDREFYEKRLRDWVMMLHIPRDRAGAELNIERAR